MYLLDIELIILLSVWQVIQPVVEDTDDVINSVLDELDLTDSAAVTSSVVSILSMMNAAPSASVSS